MGGGVEKWLSISAKQLNLNKNKKWSVFFDNLQQPHTVISNSEKLTHSNVQAWTLNTLMGFYVLFPFALATAKRLRYSIHLHGLVYNRVEWFYFLAIFENGHIAIDWLYLWDQFQKIDEICCVCARQSFYFQKITETLKMNTFLKVCRNLTFTSKNSCHKENSKL